jgi:hypothetical protein
MKKYNPRTGRLTPNNVRKWVIKFATNPDAEI